MFNFKKDKMKNEENYKKKDKKEKPPKFPKEPKVINIRKLRLIRILIYIALSALMFRGVFAIMFPSNIIDIKNDILKKIELDAINYEKIQKIKSFAEGFGSIYLSYGKYKNEEEHIARLMNFCNYRTAVELVSENRAGQSDVIQTVSLSVEKYSNNQYDVLLYADVVYKTMRETENLDINGKKEFVEVVTHEDIYLYVPIYFSENGTMLVEDIPLLTAPPTKADIDIQAITYNLAKDDDKKLANTMLEGFIPVFFSGTQSQIDYYLSGTTVFKDKFYPRSNSYTYDSILSSTIYSLENSRYLAIVTIKLKDTNGNEHKQKFSIELLKNNEKMYAVNISPRTQNLKLN